MALRLAPAGNVGEGRGGEAGATMTSRRTQNLVTWRKDSGMLHSVRGHVVGSIKRTLADRHVFEQVKP